MTQITEPTKLPLEPEPYVPGLVKPAVTTIVPIQLGDETYMMRLNFAAMKKIKELTGVDMWNGKPFQDVDLDKISVYIWASLLHANPDLPQSEIEGKLDLANMEYYIDRLTLLYTGSMPDAKPSETKAAVPNAK